MNLTKIDSIKSILDSYRLFPDHAFKEPDPVKFEDRERIDLKNLDYKLIKPLIWW